MNAPKEGAKTDSMSESTYVLNRFSRPSSVAFQTATPALLLTHERAKSNHRCGRWMCISCIVVRFHQASFCQRPRRLLIYLAWLLPHDHPRCSRLDVFHDVHAGRPGDEDDEDEDEDEDDGLNHTAAAPTTHGGDGARGGDDNEHSSFEAAASTADRNSLTMGRGSSGKLLPPPAAAPPAPPAAPLAAPPSAPTAAPPPPPTAATAGKGGRRAIKPVTDPTEALITAEPEMLSCRITPEDEFILLACDGLFDVFTSDEVGREARLGAQ